MKTISISLLAVIMLSMVACGQEKQPLPPNVIKLQAQERINITIFLLKVVIPGDLIRTDDNIIKLVISTEGGIITLFGPDGIIKEDLIELANKLAKGKQFKQITYSDVRRKFGAKWTNNLTWRNIYLDEFNMFAYQFLPN